MLASGMRELRLSLPTLQRLKAGTCQSLDGEEPCGLSLSITLLPSPLRERLGRNMPLLPSLFLLFRVFSTRSLSPVFCLSKSKAITKTPHDTPHHTPHTLRLGFPWGRRRVPCWLSPVLSSDPQELQLQI